jgi:hypothetical protein
MTERVRTRLRAVLIAPLVLTRREPEGHTGVAAQPEAFGRLEALYANTRDANGKRLLQRVERLSFPSRIDGPRTEPSMDGKVLIERAFEIAVPDGPSHVVGMIGRRAIAHREGEVELGLVEVCAERAECNIHGTPHAEVCVAGAAEHSPGGAMQHDAGTDQRQLRQLFEVSRRDRQRGRDALEAQQSFRPAGIDTGQPECMGKYRAVADETASVDDSAVLS